MSLLRGLFGRGPSTEGRAISLSEMLALDRGGVRSMAGVTVSNDSAMRHGTFWRCVNLLADLVAGFPVDLIRYVDSVRLPLAPSSLIADPSPETLALDWRRGVMVSWLLRGNAAGVISGFDRLGYPTGVELAHPDELTITRSGGKYVYRLAGRVREPYPRGDLFHIPAFTVPGQRMGLSPVRYAAESVGLGLAVRNFGSQWFEDGAHPTSIVSTEQAVDEDLARLIKRRILNAIGARREPAVLGAGLKWESIQIAPDESQFLETTKANVADVARYFGVPPELVGGESGGSLTYANVEQRSIDLLTYTVLSWVLRFEEGMTRLHPRGQFVKLNTAGLLRVSYLDRMRGHEIAIRNGIRSPNGARALEDEPPIPDVDDPARGDEYLWPPMRSTPLADGQDARSSAGRQEDR